MKIIKVVNGNQSIISLTDNDTYIILTALRYRHHKLECLKHESYCKEQSDVYQQESCAVQDVIQLFME